MNTREQSCDSVSSPAHYTVYPVQPIEIARHLSFCLGNAVKYVLRSPYKGGVEDLRKALQYLDWEMQTPGTLPSHPAYLQVETAVEAILTFLCKNRSTAADLQSYFLLCLDRYLSEGDVEHLRAMRGGVATMLLELPGGETAMVSDPERNADSIPWKMMLVRDTKMEEWLLCRFSHEQDRYYHTLYWRFCIPYEGNEHLLGTTRDAE
jgi:hypothetical protein